MNSAGARLNYQTTGKVLAGLSPHHDTILLQINAGCVVLTPIHCREEKKAEGAKQTY